MRSELSSAALAQEPPPPGAGRADRLRRLPSAAAGCRRLPLAGSRARTPVLDARDGAVRRRGRLRLSARPPPSTPARRAHADRPRSPARSRDPALLGSRAPASAACAPRTTPRKHRHFLTIVREITGEISPLRAIFVPKNQGEEQSEPTFREKPSNSACFKRMIK